MKVIGTILIVLIFALPSCKKKQERIADDEMVNIITDLLIADELIVKYGHEEKEKYKNYLKNKILEIHSLEVSQLDSIMIEYQRDLPRYHKTQSDVEKRLKELKSNSPQNTK